MFRIAQCMPCLLGFVWMLFFSDHAGASVDLNVIPQEVHTNGDVALIIEIPVPKGQVEIELLALRVDSNNDGVIDRQFGPGARFARPKIVQDLGKQLPHALDENPQLGRILYRLSAPPKPGEYVVQVKAKSDNLGAKVRKPLVVYSTEINARNNEASALSRLPHKMPKIFLSELYKSLRQGQQEVSGQPVLWKIDANGEKVQLTYSGRATDPQWAPAGRNSSWLAYSFAESPGTTLEIWILDTRNPSDRQRITNSVEDNRSPIWSPDSTRIAFVRGDTIILSHIDGSHGEETIVKHHELQQILFWDVPTHSIIYLNLHQEGQVKQIWAVDVNTKKTKALAYNPLWILIRSTAASSNAKRLLIERKSRTTQEVDIFALDFPGPTNVNLTAQFRKVRCVKPSLSTDGKEVALVVMPIH